VCEWSLVLFFHETAKRAALMDQGLIGEQCF
jgi:hypothetical protein